MCEVLQRKLDGVRLQLNGHPASILASISLDEVKMVCFSIKKEKLELFNLKCVIILIYKQSISLFLKTLGICKFVYKSFMPSLLLLTTLSCIIIPYVICKVLASIPIRKQKPETQRMY